MKVAVVGAESWGTTIASIVAQHAQVTCGHSSLLVWPAGVSPEGSGPPARAVVTSAPGVSDASSLA
jgi:hypothetical protein